MKTFSLCMIVKNEEAVIGRCLDCAKQVADEIIVVDTGSTDRTKEICREYTSKIYDFEWIDDFAAARNESYSHATMDYVFWLDADDVLLPDAIEKLLRLKETLIDEEVVMCKYDVSFDADGKPTFSYFRERLTKRSSNFAWEGCVHECIGPRGKILYSEAAVTHRKEKVQEPGRNLRIYRSMQEKGTAFSPRHLFYFARELYYNKLYEESILVFRQFLNGKMGWKVNCIDACSMLADCYRRLERRDEILPSLFESFRYDRPHAEVCCEIGNEFMLDQDHQTACFWFETALSQTPAPESGGFVLEDCYDVIPLLQLCVCCDRLGDKKKAEDYNRRAAAVRPNHPSVLANVEYFAKLKKQ